VKVFLVAGGRHNFIKIAPICRESLKTAGTIQVSSLRSQLECWNNGMVE